MRASYWLLALCCLCLGCAAEVLEQVLTAFFDDNTIVYFFYLYLFVICRAQN